MRQPERRVGGRWCCPGLVIGLVLLLAVAAPPPAGASPQPGPGAPPLVQAPVLEAPDAAAPGDAVQVTRVAGADRVGTAIAVARHGWPDGAGRVLLATAEDFPDALAAAPLAAVHDAPILLSPPSGLPAMVLEELRRLDPDEVILLGGGAALGRGVDRALDEAGLPATRVGGRDRYETAARVAALVGAGEQDYVAASGETFADALSAASLPRSGAPRPTLLLRRASVPRATSDALAGLGLGGQARGVLLGGDAAVREAVREALPGTVERAAGSTRYGTSREAVLRTLEARESQPVDLLVASGADFPDALAVGALAARLDAPLLLVPPGDLGVELAAFLQEHRKRVGGVTVVGGPAAASDVVLDQLGRVLAGLPKDPEPVWLPGVDAARTYAEGRAGSVSFAAIGTDGALVGHRAGTVVPQASVLKVMFLAAYLRHPDVRDRALDEHDRALLEPMIRRSANAPATAIADLLGPGPLEELAAEAGMVDFSYTRPWGRSTTSAQDQARFLLDLESYLPARHADEALRLLTEIVAEQRWGIGALETPGWRLHFKGGWGSGTGAVNHQVAKLVHCGGRQVSVAVMTTGSPSHDYASETLAGTFRALLDGLPSRGC